jgi:hypothetical protein
MYRRIEVLFRKAMGDDLEDDPPGLIHWARNYYKRGVWGVITGTANIGDNVVDGIDRNVAHQCSMEVWGCFASMKSPRGGREGKCYFTERGWDEVGRKVIGILKKYKAAFRVLTVKEKEFEVMFEDRVQVVLRPRKAV